MSTIPIIAGSLNDQQRAVFYAQMSAVQKDEVVGVLLALFLGSFGAHHFYLRRNGLGILYVLFFWTGIPAIAGFIECFFMPGRVRQYNMEQATLLAASLQGAVPGPIQVSAQGVAETVSAAPTITTACSTCGAPLVAGVKFCSRCGTSVPG
ncbi:MAG TPA: NINE protein [Pseudacidobacterium sp.]|nr:NINE protein [Pseudacidobacterium sp.]